MACDPSTSETGTADSTEPATEPAVAVTGQADPADTVFTGGGIYTAVPGQPLAEALAIRGDEIVFVGDSESAQDYIGPDTEVLELAGKMLMPGFHDAHAHVLAGGGTLNRCNLEDSRSQRKLLELLQKCADEYDYGPDEWVIGNRWPLAAFESGAPKKEVLDQVFGGRPAYFVDSFGHNAWVSSRALEIAGIDTLTPDPAQGVIVHDPSSGQPSGTLREDAMQLVARHIPSPSTEQLMRDLRTGLAEAARFGITSYIEPGVSRREAELFQTADREGWLSARVLGSLSPIGLDAGKFGDEVFPLVEQRSTLRSKHFSVDSVKIYIDGVIETETSFMLEPYTSGKNFAAFYQPQELVDIYQRLDAAGLQIHTHAIGDGAIRLALDAYEAARQVNGPTDNRHHICHLQLIDEQDIPRFGKLDIAANFQGLWAYPDQYIDVAADVVGDERTEKFYPVASVQRTGGRLVGGSDWDVTSLNPLDAIETLVRRQDPWAEGGPELGTNERIDLDIALAMYTRNAAWVMRQETLTGTLETGKKADLIVLDQNLFEIPVTAINETTVELTLMGGNEVYRNPAP